MCFLGLGLSVNLMGCGGGSDSVEPTISAPSLKAQVQEPSVFSVFSKSSQGLVQARLTEAAANFSDSNADTVIFNVGGALKADIIRVATAALDSGKTVVLDSDGTDGQLSVLSEISLAVAGTGSNAPATVIQKLEEGSYLVTSLDISSKDSSRNLLKRNTESSENSGNSVETVLLGK